MRITHIIHHFITIWTTHGCQHWTAATNVTEARGPRVHSLRKVSWVCGIKRGNVRKAQSTFGKEAVSLEFDQTIQSESYGAKSTQLACNQLALSMSLSMFTLLSSKFESAADTHMLADHYSGSTLSPNTAYVCIEECLSKTYMSNQPTFEYITISISVTCSDLSEVGGWGSGYQPQLCVDTIESPKHQGKCLESTLQAEFFCLLWVPDSMNIRQICFIWWWGQMWSQSSWGWPFPPFLLIALLF